VHLALAVFAIAFFAVAFLTGAFFAFTFSAGFLTLLIAGAVSGKGSRFFTGEEVTHQTVLKVHCSPGRNILLARQPVSKDVLSVKKKRKLFLAPLLASPSSTPLPKLKRKRLRNINRIPFWGLRTEPTKATLVRRWRNKKHKWKSRADNSQSYPPP